MKAQSVILQYGSGQPVSSESFTDVLHTKKIAISMDGKGRWMDNVFIERIWKSIKYEDIYLKAYGSMTELKKGLSAYFKFYNEKRWHHNFGIKTPAMVYFDSLQQNQAAA